MIVDTRYNIRAALHLALARWPTYAQHYFVA
jgi:hypothetical protein